MKNVETNLLEWKLFRATRVNLRNFTGRAQERELLTDWLTRDHHSMLSVSAIGGMGKTAVAWYWLMEDILGSDEQPRKIVWWSFYDRESSFGRFLKKAIEYFSDGEVDWNLLESIRDQMSSFIKFCAIIPFFWCLTE